MTLEELLSAHAWERPKGSPTLAPQEVAELMPLVPGWELSDDGKAIVMKRRCEGFTEAVETLNKVTPLAETEDHHPDVRVYSYRWLELLFSTHSLGGLTTNDFILAAKINRLLET